MTPDNRSLTFQMLCDRLQNSPYPEVRARCARSLGQLRYKEAIPLLCEIAKIEQDLQVCLAVISAVEEIMMPEQPKNQPTFQIGQVGNINTGDVDIQGDQIGIQYNYSTDPEVRAASIELKDLLSEIQAKNPAIATTEEAIAIIDVEFTEIKQTNTRKLAKLAQFLLDPKRHGKAIKATCAEVAKHYLEESVLAKAIITYGDTFID